MSADGSLLATASKDGTIRFWSLPDGRARGAPLRFPYGAADAQLSPNGRWLSVVALNRESCRTDWKSGTFAAVSA